ncbi:MAG: energy transducer TonB [Muribaculaceae bacterium]|nr:energy transducer TonB [Muribaculaceae bacterium]
MKRFLSILLMLTLLTGMTAMAQGRAGHRPVQKSKARTARVDKKNGVKIAKSDKAQRADCRKAEKPMEEVHGNYDTDRPEPRIDGEVIYTEPDQMPQFPGGLDGLMEYLSSNIIYPPVAAEKNIQGKVLVQFVVEKDGSVGEIKILRSVDINLDYEAIRLCKGMPKLEPGMMDGKPVRVWYTLPINFKLED